MRKTTFINLLMRFCDATSGTISIDGIPTTAMTKDSLRSQFGMVLQDTWLYLREPLRDNIAYGKPNATDEEGDCGGQRQHLQTALLCKCQTVTIPS
ncbi:MAG: ATP-binding cassette domain-containing protein [Eubacteriales bacterium]